MSSRTEYTPSSFLAVCVPRTAEASVENCAVPLAGDSANTSRLSLESASFLVQLVVSNSAQTGRSAVGAVAVVHGELYDCSAANQAEYVLEQYASHGIEAVKDLNGSFALLVIDPSTDAVYAVTDRLNSRDIFHFEEKGCHWFASTLGLIPTNRIPLSLVGLACYLANGIALNNRTVYEGVSVLERASIYSFTPAGLTSRSYWTHQYTHEYAERDSVELQDELAELLVEAVRKRTADNANYFVSLSGGYDSATILAIMVRHLGLSDIQCLSYVYGELKPDTDPGTAKRMAEFLGCPFKVVQSYSGDVTRAIGANAEIGLTMNKYCEDAEAWLELRKDLVGAMPSALFVGDECFGDVPFLRFSEINSMEDVLECVGIHNFDRWAWLSKYVSKGDFTTMRDGWQDERAQIVDRFPPSDDVRDHKDFLYLDQRVNHVLFSWRNHMMGAHARVRSPLLDNSIVDFVAKLSAEQRMFKKLYVDTVNRMFPDVFGQGICRSAPGSYPPWAEEFAAQRKAVENLLETPSRLDDIVSPDAIRRLIGSISALHSSGALSAAVQFFNKLKTSQKVPLPIRRILGGGLQTDLEKINDVVMLQRLLVLRLAVGDGRSGCTY